MDTSRYGSDPDGLWAAAEDDGYSWKTPADQRAWKRAVEADFPAAGEVMCDPCTFMPLDEVVEVSLGVLSFAPDLAENALWHAVGRMSMVTVDGREHESPEGITELELEDAQAAFSPTFISEPERRGEVVGLGSIDTRGERYTWMFRTFLRIVAEELQAEGAVPAKIVPFPSRPLSYPSDSQLA